MASALWLQQEGRRGRFGVLARKGPGSPRGWMWIEDDPEWQLWGGQTFTLDMKSEVFSDAHEAADQDTRVWGRWQWMVAEPRPTSSPKAACTERRTDSRGPRELRARWEARLELASWQRSRCPGRRAVSHVDGCRVWSDADRGLTIGGSDTLAVGDLDKDIPVETRGLGALGAVPGTPSRAVGGAEMLRPGGSVCGHGNECLLDFLFR